MNYLKRLFESAKNAVMSRVYNVASTVKERIAKSIVNEFGPEVINAGAELLTTKLTGAFTEGVKEYSPLKMLEAFINSPPPSTEPMEERFDQLLQNAKIQLDSFAKKHDTSIVKSGVHVANNLLNKLDSLKRDCFKLKNKTLAEFKNEGLEAIKLLQPQLEDELTATFVERFLAPFISFFKKLLLSLFSPEKPAITAKKSEMPSQSATKDAVKVEAVDVDEDDDIEPLNSPRYATI